MICFFFLLLVLNSKSLINKCIWAEVNQHTTLQTLFQYPQHGNCLYSILHSNSVKQPIKQFLFFLDGVSFCTQKQSNFECLFQSGPPGISCSAKCIQFFQMGEYPPIQITLTLPQKTFQYSDLNIQLSRKQETSIKQSQSIINLYLKNTIIKAKLNSKTQQLHTIDKPFQLKEQIMQWRNQLIFSLLMIIPVFLSWKQKTVSIYKWLQIGLFIEILLVSGKWMVVQLAGKLNGWELLTTVSITLIIILLQLKNFFQFVDHSTLTFSEFTPSTTENYCPQSSIFSASADTQEIISFSESLFRKLPKIIEKIKKNCMSSQWLMMLPLILLSLCRYQLVFSGIWGFLAIMSSHNLKTNGINASTPIISYTYNPSQKQVQKIHSQQRDSILFPKYKISSYFIITILKIIHNFHAIVQFLYIQMLFQILYIIIIWIITILIVHKQIQSIKGKKTYLYNNKNYQNQQIPQCSICLLEIHQQSIKTECNHIFHAECLQKWTKSKMICPIQRNTLNPNSLQNCLKKFSKQNPTCQIQH